MSVKPSPLSVKACKIIDKCESTRYYMTCFTLQVSHFFVVHKVLGHSSDPIPDNEDDIISLSSTNILEDFIIKYDILDDLV